MELQLKHLKKSYTKGKNYAIKDIDLTFTPGIYGILGPNGAGKSTLISMLTDNLKPDNGSVLYNNNEIHNLGKCYREQLGYMPQQQELYDHFTGEKFLWYMAALKGLTKKQARSKIEELLKVVNLTDVRYNKISCYSGGMKQRLLVAQAVLNDPNILILDEPTAGLDPKERIRLRNFISEMSKEKIVLIATHVVSDIEYISKEVIIMNNGEIIRKNTPKELLKELNGKVFDVFVNSEQKTYYDNSDYKIANVIHTRDGLCVRIVGETRPTIGDVREAIPNLEDLYLYLIGEN